MRAAFRSQLTNKVSDELIEFWMGHAIGTVARAYLNMPTEELRELYMDAEKYLAIEKTSREALTEQQTVKFPAEVKQKIAELETTVQTLTRQNVQLGERVKLLEKLYDKLFELKPEELRLLLQEISRLQHHRQKETDMKQHFEEILSTKQ